MALKENQAAAYNDVKDYFSIEDKDFQNTLLRFETFDIGHGREEKREYFLSSNLNRFEDKRKWANVKSFGMVKSTVKSKGKQYSEKRYFISSIEDINEFVTAVRTHWTVENTLHWSLDVIFRDDECQIREKNVP
ncbi:ISAs1 family transposase [Treponema pedis]|uniref:ISAs1 family transposase n=1 Tax=Treponema pedis TaxID=409322 RepID=UPI0006841F13|nr:ISAs1 family transposase [Treponema pedis]